MWKATVKKTYGDIESLESANENYGILERINASGGNFEDIQELWDKNPMIQGSSDPADFGLYKGKKKRKNPAVNIKKGSIVRTKLGTGRVISIDTTTYSIPAYAVKLIDGTHAGEIISQVESELVLIKENPVGKDLYVLYIKSEDDKGKTGSFLRSMKTGKQVTKTYSDLVDLYDSKEYKKLHKQVKSPFTNPRTDAPINRLNRLHDLSIKERGKGKPSGKRLSILKRGQKKLLSQNPVRKAPLTIIDLKNKYDLAIKAGQKNKAKAYLMLMQKMQKVKNPFDKDYNGIGVKRSDMFTSFRYPKGVRIIYNSTNRERWEALKKEHVHTYGAMWGSVDTRLKNGENAKVYWFGFKEGKKKSNPVKSDKLKKGIKRHKIWHSRKDKELKEKVKPYALPIERQSGKMVLVDLGRVDEITYVSDKYDGKERLWVHKFKKRPRLFTNTKGTVLMVAPVVLNKRGIIS